MFHLDSFYRTITMPKGYIHRFTYRYISININHIIFKYLIRIAETNLKKQGILPLCFAVESDYDKILEDDVIDVDADVAVGEAVYVTLRHSDGSVEAIEMKHTFSAEQLEWFKHGSALNWLREK